MDLGRPRVGCPWDKSRFSSIFALALSFVLVLCKNCSNGGRCVLAAEKNGRKMNVAPKKEQHLRQAEEATA